MEHASEPRALRQGEFRPWPTGPGSVGLGGSRPRRAARPDVPVARTPRARLPRHAHRASTRARRVGRVARWLAAGALVVGSLGVAPSTVRADDGVATAEAALARGDVPAALVAFRALAATPAGAGDPRVLGGLAAALVKSGDVRAALEPYAALVRVRGTNDDRIGYADALLAVAREAAASGPRSGLDVLPYLRDAFGQLADLSTPTAAETTRAALVEGEARWLAGDPARARAALSSPTLAADRYAQDLLARVCYAQADFAAAAAAWEVAGNRRGVAVARMLAKDPRAVDDYAALVRATPTDLDLADEACRAATSLARVDALDAAWTETPPGTLALLRLRGRLAEWAGRLPQAVERYRAARALAPDDPAVTVDFARARLAAAPDDAAGVDEAVALFVDVLKRRPDDPWARQGLEYVARRDADAIPREWPDRKRLDRAVLVYRAVTEADPTDGVAWMNLGNALRNAGDVAAALAAFDRATDANPYDAAAWNDRGIAWTAAGDRAQALASFEKAAALDPGATAPRQNAARLERLAGRFDAAAAHAAAALSSARALGGHVMLYRGILDRCWRDRRLGTR